MARSRTFIIRPDDRINSAKASVTIYYESDSVFHPGLVAGLCGWFVLERRSAAWRVAIGTVLAKINDPVRARAYAELGVATICRTTLMTDTLLGFLGMVGSGDPPIHHAREHAHPAPHAFDQVLHRHEDQAAAAAREGKG